MALSRSATPAYAATQGELIISSAPVPSVIGKRLTDAGALSTAGTYECEIATDGANVLEVELMCSALTGTVTAYLRAMRWNRASYRATAEDSGALVAGTPDVLVLTDLRGKTVCKVVFTLDAAESVTFAVGSTPATPTAVAEFNCL